ncbi:MAG TPA: ABC transporter permease, partial [Vicinamibacterales bacterium]|nr:ABC transporter permease [Vicinamibacterales bacterium]
RLRAGFVCAEVALSVLLVIGAGLLVRSFLAVQRVQLGFQPAGVLSLRLSLPRARYPRTSDLAAFHEALAARLSSVPGVAAVASANVVPMNNYLATTTIRLPGFEAQAPAAWPDVHYRMVSAGYFDVLGIAVLSGRAFDDFDRRGAMPVAIVSRGLARTYWPAGNAVGSRIEVRDDTEKSRAVEIVGIVDDVRHLGPEVASPSEIYVPLPQVPDATSIWLANNMYVAVRTPQDPLSLAGAVRGEVARVDPEVAASFVRSMEQWVGLSVQARRFNLGVIGVFALTALLLAATGVYGVAAEAVAVRTRELGVRAALGASGPQLRLGVMKDGLAPVAGGIVLGVVFAAASSGLLASFLYGVEGRDPATYAGVVALAAAAGALGLYLPSRRVTRIDPVIALRTE